MPSKLHESLVMMLSTPSALLLQSISTSPKANMPSFSEARTYSAHFTDMQPAEYRADHVTVLVDEKGTPVLGIIVETQLKRSNRKRFVWLSYVANLRSRLECPVCLLVVAPKESVARWAAKEIHFGGGYVFAPLVLGPRQVPRVTDVALACQRPELAVLSAIMHGKTVDPETAVKIGKAALHACAGLDADKRKLYSDVVNAALRKEVRQEVEKMDTKTIDYANLGQELMQEYLAKDMVRLLLIARFGAITEEIDERIDATGLEDLKVAGVRVLTAESPEQVFEGLEEW